MEVIRMTVKYYEFLASSDYASKSVLAIAVDGLVKHIYTIGSYGGSTVGNDGMVSYGANAVEAAAALESFRPCSDCNNSDNMEAGNQCTRSAWCSLQYQVNELSVSEAIEFLSCAKREEVMIAGLRVIRRYRYHYANWQ
jgi:hypothetical protein